MNICSCSGIGHRAVRNKSRAYRVVSGHTRAREVIKREGEVRMRTTLWVTTAAAALIAGTTFAGAQTGKTNEGGASSGSNQISQSQGSTQKGAASEQKGAKPGMAQGKEERTEKKDGEDKDERSRRANERPHPRA